LNIKDISQIGADESFFNLGGDSVAAIRLGSAARNANIRLNVEMLLKYPILESMAAIVKPVEARYEIGTPLGDLTTLKIKPFSLVPGEVTKFDILQRLSLDWQIPQGSVEDICWHWVLLFTQGHMTTQCRYIKNSNSEFSSLLFYRVNTTVIKPT
jgi:hypothetical protein